MIGWVCIFLMISSSLTTEGLRRRFPRPIPLRLLHEDQCGSVVRMDCLNKEVRRERSRRSRLPICAQLTDDQILRKLKDIGGYNPLYVAVNITEARKFQDPRTFEGEQPQKAKATRAPDCRKNPTPPPTTTSPTTVVQASPTRIFFNTPTSWRRPQRYAQDVKEEEMVIKKMSPLEKLRKKLNDFKEDNGKLIRKLAKRSSKVENCFSRGAYITGSRNARINMCSECQLVTRLPGDEMPQYLNEVACGHTLPKHSGQASHDDLCYASTGLCAQKYLRFPAMKRNGYIRHSGLSAVQGIDIYVEQWAIKTRDIRSGCKCEMYTRHAQLLKSIEG